MSDDSRFEYASMQDVQSIRKFLQTLNQGFENGKIVLSSDKDEVVLRPQYLLKFAIKAKKKGNKCKLSLKMSWKEVEIADSLDALKIGT
jgi:amphi-Trp domain-containing protein